MIPARVIVADCPWSYRNRHEVRRDGASSKFGIGVAARYSRGVMSTADLCALGPSVRGISAADAYLFMWAVAPSLPDALRVMEAWGFRYVSIAFFWAKTYKGGATFFGPGRYVPANAELVLLGVRGPAWHVNTGKKPLQEIRVPHPRADGKIIHSRKPEEMQDRLDAWLRPQAGGAPFVELFATRPRADWVCLGYDVTQRDIRDDLAEMRFKIAEQNLSALCEGANP